MTMALDKSGSTTAPQVDAPDQVLRRIWRRMRTRRKRQLGLLAALLLIGMVFEAATVAAVIPVVTVLADPGKAFGMTVLQPLIKALNVQVAEDLRTPLAIVFFLFVLCSAGVRLLYLWASMRLTAAIGLDFSQMAFRRTLRLPYADQTRLRTNHFITSVQKINAITARGIMPILTAFGSFVMALTIAGTLFVTEPLITLALAGTIVLVLMALVVFFRGPLRLIGHKISAIQPVFMGKLQTARGGIREIILDDTQEFFADDLTRTQGTLRRYGVIQGMLSNAPRFFIESIFILVLVAMAYWMFSRGQDVAEILPTLSLIAIGALKLLPATQTIAVHWATLRSSIPMMSDALELFDGDIPETEKDPIHTPLPFDVKIVFRDVWFRYDTAEPWILQGVNLEIKKSERIGVIGPTGAGKSTLIDLAMGLLIPTRGTISIDGMALDDFTRRAWRKRIAHVPQSIYLTDASVAENIGFGLDRRQIAPEHVVSAARRADIAHFVDDGASGFMTSVGERGNQISGGQRQRIGIARALYKEADVIVLDEATSALDTSTEERIMQTIYDLENTPTIIIIAHRLTTLKNCDRIVELEGGRVKRECRYEALEQK